MGAQFDNFGQQLKAMISSMNEIKYENKYIKEENLMMKNEVEMLSRQLNVLDQVLGCDSKVVGAPENQNEVYTETVSKIASKLQGTNVKTKNGVRIPSKITDKPKKTLVCLSSADEKRTFMDLEKKEKTMANYIDDKWSNTAVYVNGQMTSVFRNLFFKPRDTAKEVSYKFDVWLKKKKIKFVKKNLSSKTITKLLFRKLDNYSSVFSLFLCWSYFIYYEYSIDFNYTTEKYDDYNVQYYESIFEFVSK